MPGCSGGEERRDRRGKRESELFGESGEIDGVIMEREREMQYGGRGWKGKVEGR